MLTRMSPHRGLSRDTCPPLRPTGGMTQQKCAVTRATAKLWMLALAALCVLPSGCVFRRMTIRSDPPGALVLLDGEEVGYTPVSVDFTYYGTREIKLVKPGYETLTTLQRVNAPWWQTPGIDFFADNLLPYKVTDRRAYSYTLQPQTVPNTEQLLDRAKSLRSEVQVGP